MLAGVGAAEDTSGQNVPGAGQAPLKGSDSGDSGNSSQSSGGAGTAGSVPAAGPGAPQPYQ